MIKGEIFRKKVKSKGHKSGYTVKKFVIRICDLCNKIEETRYSSLEQGRVIRGCDTDLCKICANRSRNIPKGEEHGNYLHGLTKNGYKRITNKYGNRILEHRHIIEKYIDRKLDKNEVVHHIDFNKSNNEIDNLLLCKSQSEHQEIHKQLQRLLLNEIENIIWFDYSNKTYQLQKKQKKNSYTEVDIPYKKVVKVDKRYGSSYDYFWDGFRWNRVHVFIIESNIGRKITKNECVHHIDGNSLNNNVDNLCLMTKSQHSQCHSDIEKCGIKLFEQEMILFDKSTKKYCFPKCRGMRDDKGDEIVKSTAKKKGRWKKGAKKNAKT